MKPKNASDKKSAILNYGYYYRPEARNTSGVKSFDLNEAIHALALEMVASQGLWRS